MTELHTNLEGKVLVADTKSARPPLMIPPFDVPIIINSYNRLSSLRRLVAWLRESGYRRIIIVDNASTYGPLLSYLRLIRETDGIQVVFLPSNLGSRALWSAGLLDDMQIHSEYVYTDPDIVPIPDCPKDLVRVLQYILKAEPGISKIGLGLKIDDIPEHYRYRADALAWERQFWLRPVSRGLYRAEVDTTFALYRPGSDRALASDNVRIGWPYLGIHESWHADSSSPTEEEIFYKESAMPPVSTWSVERLPGWLAAESLRLSSVYPRLLNISDDLTPLTGFANAYLSAGISSDVRMHIDACGHYRLELADTSIDGIYGCIRLRGLRSPSKFLAEMLRVIKESGKLILRLSYDNDYKFPQTICDEIYADIFSATIPADPALGLSGLMGKKWIVEKMMYVRSQEFAGVSTASLFPYLRHLPPEAVEVVIHARPCHQSDPGYIDANTQPPMGYLNNPIDMSIDFSAPEPADS